MLKTIVAVSVILLGVVHHQTVSAQDFSANLGWNSEYIYRGIPQKTSSAFGGLDLTAGGFYLGGWVADVGKGVEIDYYGGYTFEVGDFGFGVGATYYTFFIVHSNDVLLGGESDTNIVLSLVKTFDF